MTKKYLNSSVQQPRILMRKMNGMVIKSDQDPDEYLTEVIQQRNKLEHIYESFTEAVILDLILKDLSDEHELITFATERDPEISLREVKTTMYSMYANRDARGSDSTFSRGKGNESAMTASSGLRGSVTNTIILATKSSSASNFCASLAGDHYLRAAW